jgi:hypothetical protein
VLFGLAEEFHFLKYYDEELWTKLIDSAIQKRKINNTHYFKAIHASISDINEDPSSGLQGKFTGKIDELVKKHYSADRKWRYDLEKRDFKSL